MQLPPRIAALALLVACGATPTGRSATADDPADKAERTAESDLEGLRARIVATGSLRRQCPGHVKDPVPRAELEAGRPPKGQLGFRAGAKTGTTGITPPLGQCRLEAPCEAAQPFQESVGWVALDFDPSASGTFPYANSYAYSWAVDADGICEMELSAWSPDAEGTYVHRTQAGTMRKGQVSWGALRIRRGVSPQDP